MPGCALSSLNMASSAIQVFPDPVGAPRRTLSSVWKRAWNACEREVQTNHSLSASEMRISLAHLCLNWIECLEWVDTLEFSVAEHFDGKRIEWKKIWRGYKIYYNHHLYVSQIQLFFTDKIPTITCLKTANKSIPTHQYVPCLPPVVCNCADRGRLMYLPLCRNQKPLATRNVSAINIMEH